MEDLRKNMATKVPVCSIVVTNYNGIRWLKGCLDSIASQTIFADIETILVDDGSDDGSAAFVGKLYPWVRLVVNPKNLGFCKSNNIGASLSSGKYLLLLNNDTKLAEDFIDVLTGYAEKNPDSDILVSKQLNYSDGSLDDIGGTVDIFGNNGSINLSDAIGAVFAGLGACLFIRRSFWEELDGFDEDYYVLAEDLDLFWRAHLLGKKVIAIPNAIYYHEGGGTIMGGKKKGERMEVSVQRRYLSERNKLTTMLKNYSSLTLLWVIPLYLSFLLLESLFLITTLRRLSIVRDIYWKALQYNVRNIRSILEKRRIIQSSRKVSDKHILRMMEPPLGKIRAFMKLGLPRFKEDVRNSI